MSKANSLLSVLLTIVSVSLTGKKPPYFDSRKPTASRLHISERHKSSSWQETCLACGPEGGNRRAIFPSGGRAMSHAQGTHRHHRPLGTSSLSHSKLQVENLLLLLVHSFTNKPTSLGFTATSSSWVALPVYRLWQQEWWLTWLCFYHPRAEEAGWIWGPWLSPGLAPADTDT